MQRLFQPLCAITLAAGLCAPAAAADAVTDAMQSAYAPYRVALFKTNAKSQAESSTAIAEAIDAWSQLRTRFAAQPPAPYDRDALFARTLEQVDAVYRQAQKEAAANQLSQAHETLEQARDLMAQLRQRNHVFIFSDAMNAYHAQMERVLQTDPKAWAQPSMHLRLAASVGTLDYLAQQLVQATPPAYAAKPEFQRGLQAIHDSVQALQQALWAQQDAAAQQALGKLKAPYSKFFLQFG